MTAQTEAEHALSKLKAEETYKEVREKDAMTKEEALSSAVEFEAEEGRKDLFHEMLLDIINAKGVSKTQIINLKKISFGLKRISIVEEFADNHLSWDRLESRVFETLAAEEEAKQLEDRLKTEQGRERQRLILEHAEDIDEMSAFFYKDCSLGEYMS